MCGTICVKCLSSCISHKKLGGALLRIPECEIRFYRAKQNFKSRKAGTLAEQSRTLRLTKPTAHLLGTISPKTVDRKTPPGKGRTTRATTRETTSATRIATRRTATEFNQSKEIFKIPVISIKSIRQREEFCAETFCTKM